MSTRDSKFLDQRNYKHIEIMQQNISEATTIFPLQCMDWTIKSQKETTKRIERKSLLICPKNVKFTALGKSQMPNNLVDADYSGWESQKSEVYLACNNVRTENSPLTHFLFFFFTLGIGGKLTEEK